MPVGYTVDDFQKADEICSHYNATPRMLIAQAIAEERERCAKIAETVKIPTTGFGNGDARRAIAAAIRPSNG